MTDGNDVGRAVSERDVEFAGVPEVVSEHVIAGGRGEPVDNPGSVEGSADKPVDSGVNHGDDGGAFGFGEVHHRDRIAVGIEQVDIGG